MIYYMPKGIDFKAAMDKGWIVPGNFLGKLECTRSLTREEAAAWESYLKAKDLVKKEVKFNLLDLDKVFAGV